MRRSSWIKIAAGGALVLTVVGTQCRSSATAQVINQMRICGSVFEKDKVPLAKTSAMVKLRVKGTQYAFSKSGGMPFETVDNLSVGEAVRLDGKGRFCTGLIKLDSYYKTSSMQILNLAFIFDERVVEGRLANGELSGSDRNTLHLFVDFNFSKPFDGATMSRFMTEEAEELFGAEQRRIASKAASKAVAPRVEVKKIKPKTK